MTNLSQTLCNSVLTNLVALPISFKSIMNTSAVHRGIDLTIQPDCIESLGSAYFMIKLHKEVVLFYRLILKSRFDNAMETRVSTVTSNLIDQSQQFD